MSTAKATDFNEIYNSWTLAIRFLSKKEIDNKGNRHFDKQWVDVPITIEPSEEESMRFKII